MLGTPPQQLQRTSKRSGVLGNDWGRAPDGGRYLCNTCGGYKRRVAKGPLHLQRFPDDPQYPCNGCVPSWNRKTYPCCTCAPFVNRPKVACNGYKQPSTKDLRPTSADPYRATFFDRKHPFTPYGKDALEGSWPSLSITAFRIAREHRRRRLRPA